MNLRHRQSLPKGSAAKMDFACQNKQQSCSGNNVFLSSSKTSLLPTFNIYICGDLPVAQKFCFRKIFEEQNSCNPLLWQRKTHFVVKRFLKMGSQTPLLPLLLSFTPK